ncbi:MAG: aminopeptidase P family protein [Peptostreptococcaceae bacterium]|nr:aminopeptidase P family protein [Peptostreptococcaceae bacterium]
MTHRIATLKSGLKLDFGEGLLLFKPVNFRYYASFTGTSGFIYSDASGDFFLTDSRYVEQAKKQCMGFEIVELSKDFTIYNFLEAKGLNRLYVEENYITMALHGKLRKSLENTPIIGMDAFISNQRIIKETSEIEKISRAAKIADEAFSHIIGFIKPGMTEKEIAFELEFFMRRSGAEGLSFETIVASGVRSSMPHGAPTDKRVEEGEFITMDFGCMVEGYCSDMTRTVHLGPASEEERNVYQVVLKAQNEAMKSIMEGMTCVSVDKIARDIIMENGYGDYFGHGLGHGVGLEIHEEPFLSPLGDKMLRAGMVVTDEPGIYIPGKFGVRIEDLVVVRENGCDVLSNSRKELIEI